MAVITALTIDAVSRLSLLKTNSLEIVEHINGRNSARLSIWSSNGSYQPDFDDEVIIDIDSTNVFTGIVTERQIDYVAMGSGTLTTIGCSDYSSYADRRVIKASTAGGITGRDAADYIVDNYLSVYGVTRDAGMAAGGTLGAVSYDYAKISDVLDDILRMVAANGWCWRINEDKELEAFLPGTGSWACPFSITTGGGLLVGDLSKREVREEYANRIYLSYQDGSDTPAVAVAENTTEITAHGIYEAAFSNQGPMDAATAQAMADGYLDQLAVVPTEVTFTTQEPGARAGQTVTVNVAARSINDDFLITSLRVWDRDGQLFYRITATSDGTSPIIKPRWKETYKLWAGQAPASGGGARWSGVAPTNVIFTQNFESGSTLTTLGVVRYNGTAGGFGCANTTAEGLNGTTWGMLASDDYPEAGFDLGSPGFGSTRSGWVEFYSDFSNLQDYGWTLVAATAGNYTTASHAMFDLYVGTESGSRYFWINTGEVTTQTRSSSNLFAASTEQRIRVHWRQSTYTGGVANEDGTLSVFVNDEQVWSLNGLTMARGTGGATDSEEITRFYLNPCGRLDEIRVGYGAYTPPQA